MLGFVCELTAKCNLQCSFCYNTWRSPNVPLPKSLAPETFATLLINTLRDANAGWVAFAGGEPLLYPKLAQIMQTINQALPEIKIGLASNGTALTSKRLDELIQSGLSYVELSLFAASHERYKCLTGADLLDHAHNAILTVKDRGLPLTIACTLLADGLDEFENIVLTAMTLGADFFAINPFTPTGYGALQADTHALSQQQIHTYLKLAQQLAQHIPTMSFTVTMPVEDCIISHAQYPNLKFSSCTCGLNKWVIDPEGFLRICEQNPERLGNLAINSFTELSKLPSVKRFREQNRFAKCTSCKQYGECGGGCRFRRTRDQHKIFFINSDFVSLDIF